MKEVEYHHWYLPNKNPRGKPYLSRWKMSAEDAAARGAIRPEPSSREVRMHAETDAEREEQRRLTDTAAFRHNGT